MWSFFVLPMYCGFLPQSRDVQLVGLFGDFNLPIGGNVRVNNCLSLSRREWMDMQINISL